MPFLLYCPASGQQINMEKSSIHFAMGCTNQIQEEIKEMWNIHIVALNGKYLGMPTDVRNSVNGVFKHLKDRVWNKL